MGFIIDTNIENLGLERRKESYYIYELEGEDEGRKDHEIFAFGLKGTYKSPTIEITKEFLAKILKYFDEHPNEKENLRIKNETKKTEKRGDGE